MVMRSIKAKFSLSQLILHRPNQFVLIYTLLGLFNFVTLERYPQLFVDEPWLAARAWGFIKNGIAFGALDAGVADKFPIHTTFFSLFTTIFQSLLLRFYTTPQIIPLRIISLIFGMILLRSIYLIGRRLHSHIVGLGGMIFTALSWPFFTSAHLGRQDIFVAACGFSAIAIYFTDNHKRFWLGLISGLLVGLAFEMHAHGLIYGFALVGLYFYDYRWSAYRNRHILGMFCGASLMIAFYVGWHILPDPISYFELYQLEFFHTHVPPILSMDANIMLLSIKQTIDPWIYYYPFTLPLLVLWPIMKIPRKVEKNLTRVYLLAALLYLGVILFVRNKMFYYVISMTPAFSLLLASLLYEIKNIPSTFTATYLIRKIGIILLILSPLVHFYITWDLTEGQLDTRALEPVRSIVTRDDIVLGPQDCWLPLFENQYFAWFQLKMFQRYMPDSSLEASISAFKPDVIILDGHTDFFTSTEPFSDPYYEFQRINSNELKAFIDQYAVLITKLQYNNTRIYRINWLDKQ